MSKAQQLSLAVLAIWLKSQSPTKPEERGSAEAARTSNLSRHHSTFHLCATLVQVRVRPVMAAQPSPHPRGGVKSLPFAHMWTEQWWMERNGCSSGENRRCTSGQSEGIRRAPMLVRWRTGGERVRPAQWVCTGSTLIGRRFRQTRAGKGALSV